MYWKHSRRISELGTLIERLYVDNVSGKVTDERYEKMSMKLKRNRLISSRPLLR